MNPLYFQLPGWGAELFQWRPKYQFYDVDEALDRRYRQRQWISKRTARLSELWNRLMERERRLLHHPRPLAHANIKPVSNRTNRFN